MPRPIDPPAKHDGSAKQPTAAPGSRSRPARWTARLESERPSTYWASLIRLWPGQLVASSSEPFPSSAATHGFLATRNPHGRGMAQRLASSPSRPGLPAARPHRRALPHLFSDPRDGGSTHRRSERITAVAFLRPDRCRCAIALECAGALVTASHPQRSAPLAPAGGG